MTAIITDFWGNGKGTIRPRDTKQPTELSQENRRKTRKLKKDLKTGSREAF